MNQQSPVSHDVPDELHWLAADLRSSAPAAPDALLARIQRTMGKSTAHTSGARTFSGGVRWVALVLVGVGLSSWGVTLSRSKATSLRGQEETIPKSSVAPRSGEWMRLLEPWPRMALAQSRSPMPVPPELALTYPLRMRAGKLRFERERSATGQPAERTEWLVELERHEQRDWVIWVAKRTGPAHVSDEQKEVDLFVVEDAPRTPLHRGVSVGADTLRMQFTPRAVVLTERRRPKTFGTASDGSFPRYMGNLRFDRSRLVAVNEDHLAMLLAHAPLAFGWTGRVAVPSQIGPVIGSYSTHDLHMRVAALDTLTIAGQARSAWRVELLTGTTPDRWWIDSRTGELLRTVVVRDGVTDDTRLLSATRR